MSPPKNVEINAPCKINVHLRIKNRRADGYHDLESVFLALDFGDTLKFERIGGRNACHVGLDWTAETLPETPIQLTSIEQAADLFRKRTGFEEGIRIQVEKRIPIGAGLGGGSSDAAATLQALNRMAGTPLTDQDLREMALQLGSDVPFFLHGGAAWVSGRGEHITPIAVPQGIAVVLVYPGFPSGTKNAYRLLDEVRASPASGLDALPTGSDAEVPHPLACAEADDSEAGKRTRVSELTPAGRAGNPLAGVLAGHPAEWRFENDFLPVLLSAGVPAEAEAYRETLEALKSAGADFNGLSGSGSACFGVFTDAAAARKAAQAVSGKKFAELTFPLAHFAEAVIE